MTSSLGSVRDFSLTPEAIQHRAAEADYAANDDNYRHNLGVLLRRMRV